MRKRGSQQIEDRPAPLRPAAFHGLLGEIVRIIEPHSEADPAALLLNLIAVFGFLCGRKAYFRVGGARHYPALYVATIGKTSKSRKGTAWSDIKWFVEALPNWPRDRVKNGGLSTGEGLISSAATPGDTTPLLVVEEEFGRTLRAMKRHTNNLSAVLRGAWDRGEMNILTRREPVSVEDAHVVVLFHITENELAEALEVGELYNGFVNRITWCCADRSKLLPFGGSLSELDVDGLRNRLASAVDSAPIGQVTWHSHAGEKWKRVYEELAQPLGEPLDSAIGRAPPQICRIALVFALADGSSVICLEHLNAALAVWDYAEESTRHIFAKGLGNPTSERILKLLRRSADGATRTEISNHFGRHLTGAEIDDALQLLDQNQLARKSIKPTAGRPVELWYPINESENGEESEQTNDREFKLANLLDCTNDPSPEYDLDGPEFFQDVPRAKS